MGEERFEMKPYGLRYKCDCGGEMLPTGQMLMSNPPQFQHECRECKNIVILKEKYPTVRWEKHIGGNVKDSPNSAKNITTYHSSSLGGGDLR